MCVTEIYTDRYPNGAEHQFAQTLLCALGEPGRPCSRHTTDRRSPRNIQFGEPTSEYILLSPRSSTSSPRPSSRDLAVEVPRIERERRRKRKSSGLFFDAFFGEASTRTRTRPRDGQGRRTERVIYVDTPPSPLAMPSPRFAPDVYSTSPLRSRFGPEVYVTSPPSPPPHPIIRDASPPRGRTRATTPIIHNPRRPRAASTEGVVGARSLSRVATAADPSPQLSYAQLRARNERAASVERQRARDERAARLAAEVEAERARRRREHIRALENAEINARVPLRPQRLTAAGARPVVAQGGRPVHELFGEMNLNSRTERAIAEAATERWRRGAAEDAEDQRERLRRRFTVGGGARAGGALDGRARRRDRIVYDQGYRF